MKLFNRSKPDINSISFPTFGWRLETKTKAVKYWINEEETMALTVNYFDLEPDLPSIKDIDTLREFYRTQIAEANGGLIQVDLVKIAGYTFIQTLFKIPQEPSGMLYLVSLTIPFENCSYVIKIQAPEFEPTGMRDSIIADKLMQKGEISAGENGYENWMTDPYDPEFKGGTLMNKSEAANYDKDFLDHPLSQARKMIGEIITQLAFKSVLDKAPRFEK
ncbi:MAG: hypothetical protein ACI8ZM_000296 [Crocinitomix sp.]|jgi:hypothetical protein